MCTLCSSTWVWRLRNWNKQHHLACVCTRLISKMINFEKKAYRYIITLHLHLLIMISRYILWKILLYKFKQKSFGQTKYPWNFQFSQHCYYHVMFDSCSSVSFERPSIKSCLLWIECLCLRIYVIWIYQVKRHTQYYVF